jgi:hypothetical protein
MSDLGDITIETALGSKVKRVECYISYQFGDSIPVLCLTYLELEDGRKFHLEGEHDLAYLPIEVNRMSMDKLLAACPDCDGPESKDRLEEYYKGNI